MRKIIKGEDTHYIFNSNLNDIPVVISIPHSGVFITSTMADNLIEGLILPNTDWYLPQLYGFLKELGFTVIINNLNRHLIDVNRDISDKNEKSYRTSLIYKNTTQGYQMYKQELTIAEINARIDDYYLSYHKALEDALLEKLKYFKRVYLIDLHSFGLDYGADIILGNNNGKSCGSKTTTFFKKGFKQQGFRVSENNPFSGGYITRHYGTKLKNCEALQIELWYQTYIAKRLFGNEELPKIDRELFNATNKKIKTIFLDLKKWVLTK